MERKQKMTKDPKMKKSPIKKGTPDEKRNDVKTKEKTLEK